MNEEQQSVARVNFEGYIRNAPMKHLVAARRWYLDAHDLAVSLVEMGNLNLDQAACVISLLSIRRSWSQNKALSIRFAANPSLDSDSMPIMSAHKKILRNIVESPSDPFAALKGLKTRSFARNIAGFHSYVTIDRWMLRAAGLNGEKTPTATEYRFLSGLVSDIASDIDESPATAQALIWIEIRGGGE